MGLWNSIFGDSSAGRPPTPPGVAALRESIKAFLILYLTTHGFPDTLSTQAVLALDALIFGAAGLLGKIVRNYLAAKGFPTWLINIVPL